MRLKMCPRWTALAMWTGWQMFSYFLFLIINYDLIITNLRQITNAADLTETIN